MKKIKGLVLSVLALGCLAMASCTPKGNDKYTVTLMYNGEVISTTEKDKATHLDAPAAPAKEGYTFVGWYVDAELTVPYTPDLLSANLTLYAKYEANTLYVTFNLNGGTLTETKVAVKTGEAYTLPTPTKEGYTFAGWTLDGEAFPASGTYTRTGSVRVSASWTINKYTVTFTDGTATLATVANVEHGTKVQAWNNPAPGYEVVGIYTDEQMTTVYDFDAPVTGALTLYVKIQAKAFTINTVLGGGKVDGETEYSLATAYDAQYALSTPTRDGYDFVGWTLDGAAFTATGKYDKLTNITVYANWTIKKYTVTFTDGTNVLSTVQNVEHGETVQAWNSPEAGYEVVGIYTDAEKTTEYDFDTPVTGALTLYVKIAPKTFTIQVNTNGGSNVNTTAKFGGTYTIATPTRDGHEFRGFLLNGEAFPATGTYTWTTDIVLSVDWYRDPMYQRSTISFYDGTVEIKSITVDDGTALSNLEGAPAKDGYAFDGWYTDANCTTAFVDGTVVNEDIKLYAKYTPNPYVLTVNPDNGAGTYTIDVTFGGEYALTAPTKEGYTFKGWKLANGANFDATGTYTTAGDIEVTASWEINRYKVSFMYNGNPLSVLDKVEHGTKITFAYTPQVGYEVAGVYTDEAMTQAYDFNNPVTGALTLYVKIQPKAYTLYLNLDGGTIDGETTISITYGTAYTLSTPVKNGYKFEGYKYNNSAFAASGTYNYATDITVFAVWTKLDADADEETNETFLAKGNYFKEREDTDSPFTFVFVTGKQYTFEGTTSVTALNAGNAVTQDGAIVFTANKAIGSFTLQVTKVVEGTSITYTRSAKIVDQVTTFDGGADYVTVWGATGEANRANNFRNAKAGTAMAVGASNFIPDLNLGSLTQAQAYMQVTAKADGAETTAFTYNNGVINFDNSLIGKTVELTFAPKYSLTGETEVMTVLVNNGVNVYTNDEMRTYYGSAAVRTINLLRHIKAEIPKTYGQGGYYMDDTYTIPQNTYDHGVYTRRVSNISDSIVVNGNFFKIDGSDLPLGDNRVDGREPQGSLPNYYVQNMQIGLFLYYYTVDESCSHLGQATFNDLFLSANYTKAADWSEADGDVTVLKSSGTYHGIVLRGGTATVNNTTITNTNIALFNGSEGGNFNVVGDTHVAPCQWIVNEAKLYHSWSNQVYMYGFTKLDITNSYLGDCGGAAIHLDDIAVDATSTSLQTKVSMDMATKVENWVTLEEAYFSARGMSTLAGPLKSGVDDGTSTATGGLLTVLQANGSMNFALLVLPKGENSDWGADAQTHPSIEVTMNTLQALGTVEGIMGVLQAGGQVYTAFEQSVTGFGYVIGFVQAFPKG